MLPNGSAGSSSTARSTSAPPSRRSTRSWSGSTRIPRSSAGTACRLRKRPPLVSPSTWSFDLMVGIGFFLLALATWQGWWWCPRRLLVTAWFAGAICRQRRGGGGRDGGGVGRHRGRPPAVDRVPRLAGQPGGHLIQRGPGHAGGDPCPVRDLDGGLDRRSDGHVTAVAAGNARRRGGRAGAVRPLAGRGRASRTGPGAPPAVPRASPGGPEPP